jgi:DDE superfamily endonuclease
MFHLPVDWLVIVQTFALLFSAAVWPCAQRLLLGAILAPGKRTVSSILRVLGAGQTPRFQNYHRVLNRATWSARQGARLLLGLLMETFAPAVKGSVIRATCPQKKALPSDFFSFSKPVLFEAASDTLHPDPNLRFRLLNRTP